MNHLPNDIVENAEHIEIIESLLSTALGDRVVFQKTPEKIIAEAATEAIVAQILARASWTKSPCAAAEVATRPNLALTTKAVQTD